MASTTGSSRMKNSMMQNKSGMVITLDTSGFTKENITVEVEGNWLIVEALATSAQPGKGGYLQRHMMRRFELRPQSDVANITIELNERANRLIVKVPRKKPQVTV
ncbi:protein lethal(2)essential for life-like [Nesidiocoris tenuis]|uniref:Protein lethal(2)essential for life-like n=1 Tax=Nesidiocoris tenuis TaxID=355587 RepID=A0ABN7AWM9_9HEMI|nr:protein lethal(2)essential for life-like [Nesidiocoris tenuis]